MKIKIFPTLLVVTFLSIFVMFYKGLQNSNIYTPNVDSKKNIPKFEAKKFDTFQIVNSENFFLENRFYLLNIWASWCIPCREEHSYIENLSKIENLEIVGLNYKDNTQNAKNFLRDLGNPYDTIFLDFDGTLAIDWGAYGVPETFLIYNKEIIKKIIGPINDSSFLEIKKIIK